MTNPRIEAAARELKRLFSESETAPDSMWLSCAKSILDAADAVARIDPWIEVVPRWQLPPAPPTGGGNGV